MTHKQREAIIRHGKQLLAIFPMATTRDPLDLCKLLRHQENKAHAIALRLCNGPEYPSEEAVDDACEAVLTHTRKILGAGPSIFLNRDPRGYALKLTEAASKHVNIHKDWGGYGIIAPEIGKEG